MFTKLTDNTLFIVLTFLPFKEAARTCVLAKRWRHAWRATKNIEFNERFFVRFGESDENKETQRLVFIQFARQWMENYQESNIENFHLTFLKPGIFRGEMDRCIAFALNRNVKVLGLDFSDPAWGEDDLESHAAAFDLPLDVYGHAVLESLKLFSCSFRVSEFTKFGALKEVSLGWIDLKMSVVEAILVNCRVLESLSLKKCWNLEHLDIKGPNLRLKSLVVDKCIFLEGWYGIEAPNLKFLKYSGKVGFFEIEINRSCMKEADLDFGFELEFDEAAGHLLYRLIEQLYPVRILTVCSYMLQVIPSGEEPLRMSFPLSIQHLIMKTSMHANEFYGIKFFMHSCPHLERLTAQIGAGRIFDDYEPPFELNPNNFWTNDFTFDFKCLNRTLTVVEVKGFKGTEHELDFLRCLLCYGRVLQRLDITVSKEGGNVEEYHRRAQRLQKFRKASPSLQISIY